jgi:adenylate cyclase
MMLHRVLNEFTEVIISNRGVIDKYIGDCVMAFWGTPVRSEDDEAAACQAALDCLASLETINRDFRQAGYPEISVRIGIHSGDVIAGNLGSDRLFDFTVVGDTVNTASRLESANKFFSTRIIVSEETLSRTGAAFVARELGLIEVKGKAQPVGIHELLRRQGTEDPEEDQIVGLFHDALTAFRKGQWPEAESLLDALLAVRPEDGPALFYKSRIAGISSGMNLTDRPDILRMKEK